jgi:GT2 family glycosyltransferase
LFGSKLGVDFLKVGSPKLSCVILAYNSSRTIRKCINSLIEASGVSGVEVQIIVVDNGSTDGSVEILADLLSKEPAVELIKLESNLGTTVSRNLALVQAKGAFVLVLDSDAYIDGSALGQLVREVELDGSIGILAPRLIFPDGRPQLSTDRFPTLGRKINRFFRLRSMELGLDCGERRDVDYAISACWLLRRSTFELVGKLDEKIFYAPEDADYCLRVWKYGLRVVYTPSVNVVHDAQERSRKLLPNRFTWLHVKGLAYFFWKHGYFLRPPRPRPDRV